MNKLAIISNDKDEGAWVVIRGINEIMKRHPGKIEVGPLEKLDLSDLDDSDILYILGHGSATAIQDYSGAEVGAMLAQNKLPNKKVRIRLLACETGLYSAKKTTWQVGSGKKDVKGYESFSKDLQKALLAKKLNACTIECPHGNVVLLGATEGDNAIDPTKGNVFSVYNPLYGKYKNELEVINEALCKRIGAKEAFDKIAQRYAGNKVLKDFFAEWNVAVKKFLFSDNMAWRIISM